MARKKVNYLNNKDMLKEIHKSKNSFCSFVEKEYANYDIILTDINKINKNTIQEAKENKAKALSTAAYDEAKAAGKQVKQAEFYVDPESLETNDLIFRIMTFDHIPDEPGRKKNPKTVADHKIKLNFPPFQHYKFNEDGELVCVGKSHWEGGMETDILTKNAE